MEDDDTLAWWVDEVPLEWLGLNVSPGLLTEKSYRSENEANFVRGEDGGYLPAEMDGIVKDGDFLKIAGNWYEIRDFAVIREKLGLLYVTLTRSIIRSSKWKNVTYAKKVEGQDVMVGKGLVSAIQACYLSTY